VRPPIDSGAVLVTGASSGIGLALTEQLARRCRSIALVARRRERLDQLATRLKASRPELIIHVVGCDLGDRGALDAMVGEVTAAIGPIDVLVNCAGFGDLSVFDLSRWERSEQMIELNIRALARLTHHVVPGMKARGRGGVLNISSGMGLTFLPGFATYVGTKHFVTGFTESLRLDLGGSGVVITQSCPGPVSSEFAGEVGNFTGIDTPGLLEISAEQCARESIRAFDRGRAMVIPGTLAWLLTQAAIVTPRPLLRLVLAPVAAQLRQRQEQAAARPQP
jgi:hypothetical protein